MLCASAEDAIPGAGPNTGTADTSVGGRMTSAFGVPVASTDNSLRGGDHGPMLLEDFNFLEKIQQFDRERIPERVVHARGHGMFGFFEPYHGQGGPDISAYSRAAVFKDKLTPVFMRLSNVQGSRGSADNVRDVRGFAVKFYTSEGIWDLVGNNIPVFFIQDGIKFPDLVHALKPEPKDEMPQAATAHNSFWDFISMTSESIHMAMWILSDRTVPRYLRTMQGFGVHTFILQNEAGDEHLVKFHWIPKAGCISNLWDEQQKTAGKDPDFNRRDLYESIEAGNFPEWELGVQIVKPEDAEKFDFDVLDSTKILPEDLVPVQKIGRMVLNRVPDEFFTQVEEAGFAPARVPPGITFSNDPLLQSRVFSYHDTQLHRLGPNFHRLPTNRSLAPVANHERDGLMRFEVNANPINYHPHGSGKEKEPVPEPVEDGSYSPAKHSGQFGAAAAGKISTSKTFARPEKFAEHYLQATLFYNSLSEPEKNHLVAAAWFELGKVSKKAIRERMVEHFNKVDHELAKRVASGLGVPAPAQGVNKNHGQRTSGISLTDFPPTDIVGRKVAVLAAEGADVQQINAIKAWFMKERAVCEVVAPTFGPIKSEDGNMEIFPDKTLMLVSSTFYDAVVVVGGAETHLDALKRDGLAVHFVNETFKHCKQIGAIGNGIDLLAASSLPAIGWSNSTASTSPDDAMTSKIGSSISKMAQKAMSAATEAVPQGTQIELGVVTSWATGQSDIEKVCEGLKASMLKPRIFKREDDPRIPA